VEVGGGGESWKWRVLPHVEVDTARRSHLRLIWALNVINGSQFDGQALWPVVWRFPAGWVLVHLHHCHLKTTRARQTGPRNKPQEKQTRETIAMIHTWIVSSLMLVVYMTFQQPQIVFIYSIIPYQSTFSRVPNHRKNHINFVLNYRLIKKDVNKQIKLFLLIKGGASQ